MCVSYDPRRLWRQDDRIGLAHHHHASPALHSNKRDFVARNDGQVRHRPTNALRSRRNFDVSAQTQSLQCDLVDLTKDACTAHRARTCG